MDDILVEKDKTADVEGMMGRQMCHEWEDMFEGLLGIEGRFFEGIFYILRTDVPEVSIGGEFELFCVSGGVYAGDNVSRMRLD